MKCKYKRLPKAAYINYEEDYCSNAVLRPVVQPTYLTGWLIKGNSEVHGNEIWSCGEYNATDGKYHILVRPLGGSIVDIALDEPLRRVNDVSDMITYVLYEYDDVMGGVFYINRYLASFSVDKLTVYDVSEGKTAGSYYCLTNSTYTNGVAYSAGSSKIPDILCNKIHTVLNFREGGAYNGECIMMNNKRICVKNAAIEQTVESYQSYLDSLGPIEIIYPLKTRINKLYEVLIQILEAESYTCVTIPGSKAVGWSSFLVMG